MRGRRRAQRFGSPCRRGAGQQRGELLVVGRALLQRASPRRRQTAGPPPPSRIAARDRRFVLAGREAQPRGELLGDSVRRRRAAASASPSRAVSAISGAKPSAPTCAATRAIASASAGSLGAGEHARLRLLAQQRRLALVERAEAGGHIGLEREQVQHALAEGVDGLDLQAARRLDDAREQFARQLQIGAARRRRAERRRCRRRAPRRRARVHFASRSNTRSAMLAAAALVKVRQRIFEGAAPASSSRTHALRQHMRLAGAGVGGHPGGALRVGGLALPPRGVLQARGSRLVPFGERPFRDAGEMVVIRALGDEFREGPRDIAGRRDRG